MLLKMRQLVRESRKPGETFYDIPALCSFVRHHLVYTDDVPVEVIRTPENMLGAISRTGTFVGDCDDASILCAYYAYHSQIPVRFVAIERSMFDGYYSHVFCEMYDENQWCWIQCDATEPDTTMIQYWKAMKVLV